MDMATMEREKLNQLLLLRPKLSQVTFTTATPTDMVMDMVDMVIMDMATMAREKLNQLLSLSQDIFIMATPTDMVMDMVDTVIMDMATMEREKLNQLLLLRPKLSQVTFTTATPTDMVIMATMEREKLKLPRDIFMVTMDMEDTDTHMVTMAMDTMVKQQLFFLTV